MRDDPSYQEYFKRWSELYQDTNYDKGLTGFFLKRSHQWSEKDFGDNSYFEKVLEVGAGTGEHLKYVRHGFREYWLTDLNPPFLDQIASHKTHSKQGKICIEKQDATALTFAEESFDRVIAAHVLEHLVHPEKTLREWMRVLKPGGILTVLLPCDPGVGWRLGRFLVARNKFIEAGIDYDYWIAREHVNPINNSVTFIRYYFPKLKESWLPMKIPSIDLNLFYVANITKD